MRYKIKKVNNFLIELERYFKETPIDKIKSDWEKSKEADEIGPTVNDLFDWYVPIFPSDQLEKPITIKKPEKIGLEFPSGLFFLCLIKSYNLI